MDLYVTMSYGVTVYFGDKDALKVSTYNSFEDILIDIDTYLHNL